MATTEAHIHDLTAAINAKLGEYRAGGDGLTVAKARELTTTINALQQQRSKAIADGCPPCPSCGAQPLGMVQVIEIDREPHDAFEVGCPHCGDHRAKDTSLDRCRQKWALGPSTDAEHDDNGVQLRAAVRGWVKPKGGRKIERHPEHGIVSTAADGTVVKWRGDHDVRTRRRLALALRNASPNEPQIGRAAGGGRK
jgi:hypothetical protein